MANYPALVLAIQSKARLKRAVLVRLDFKSETMFVWNGFGSFRDNNKQVWSGLGRLGQVSDIDRALVSSQTPTLTLSGVDSTIASKALQSSSEVKGQPVRVFEQYFDMDTSQPVDVPCPIWTGLMDRARISVAANQATVSVSTVTLLYRRRRPAIAYLSDTTQRQLFPGDSGCSEIPRLVQADENWPNY